MVDISYTTLHKRTGEGGWLATLSTPPGSAPVTVSYGHSSDNGNVGKVGKVSNVGGVGHSSDKLVMLVP